MVVAFTTEHVLAALSQRPTALVQEYIRHSNVMNKCYILNGNVRIDVRSSLDVDETGMPPLLSYCIVVHLTN